MLLLAKKTTAATVSSVEALAQGLFRYASIEKTVSFKLPHFASHDQYKDTYFLMIMNTVTIPLVYFSIEK